MICFMRGGNAMMYGGCGSAAAEDCRGVERLWGEDNVVLRQRGGSWARGE